MKITPFRGLKDLGKLVWERRAVVQAPGQRESFVELSRISEPVDPRKSFVVRIGPITSMPMTEDEARKRFIEEAVFIMGNSGKKT